MGLCTGPGVARGWPPSLARVALKKFLRTSEVEFPDPGADEPLGGAGGMPVRAPKLMVTFGTGAAEPGFGKSAGPFVLGPQSKETKGDGRYSTELFGCRPGRNSPLLGTYPEGVLSHQT